MTTTERDGTRDLEDALAILATAEGGGDPTATVIERLGGVRIRGARREALTQLHAGRSQRSRELRRALDVLDAALDRLDGSPGR